MTNTDKTVSTERQTNAELVEQLRRLVDEQEGGDAVVLVQRQLFNRVVGWLAKASRTQSPAEWQVEKALASWFGDDWPKMGRLARSGVKANMRAALRAASITPPASRPAVSDVLAERQRQVAKGYDAAHDDEHVGGEIITHPVWGAMARLQAASQIQTPMEYRAALVEAVAMGLAEIERLNRIMETGK